MSKGYFHRDPIIKTHSQMMATLQERTSGRRGEEQLPSEPPSIVASPSTPAAGMLSWLPKVKGMEAILSACGRYSISRAAVDGKFCYTAWKRLPTPTPIGEAVYLPDLAKELCEADAKS